MLYSGVSWADSERGPLRYVRHPWTIEHHDVQVYQEMDFRHSNDNHMSKIFNPEQPENRSWKHKFDKNLH